jgi:hypothetical protein
MNTAKIIAKEYNDNGASYRIQWPCGMKLWFDVYTDEYGDVNGDWNKYIFHTDDEQDMKEKAFQEAHNDEVGAYNFADALALAAADYQDRDNA